MLWNYSEICNTEKISRIYQQKVCSVSVFGFDTFLTMLNALWWIYKKARRGIFNFMFLVSSVLVMVSKNLLLCFGQGHIELFQCSAEGCAREVTHSFYNIKANYSFYNIKANYSFYSVDVKLMQQQIKTTRDMTCT